MIEQTDYDARVVALQQAAHDNKGNRPAADVVLAAETYYGFLSAAPGAKAKAHTIDSLVDRFLQWKLPDTFAPDGGITFTPPQHPNHPWPVGTNLLDATQAKAMLLHVLSDNP